MDLAPWTPDDVGDPDSAALARAGLDALRSATRSPGRVRDSAFHLLAADALLTYACEAALEEEAPEDTLWTIFRDIAGSG